MISFEMLDSLRDIFVSLDKLYKCRKSYSINFCVEESNKRFIGLIKSPINDLLDSFGIQNRGLFCIVDNKDI